MAEALKLECSIDFEDEWRQLECHWDYKRFFTVKGKVFHGPLYDCLGTKTGEGENIGYNLVSAKDKVDFSYKIGNWIGKTAVFTTIGTTVYKLGTKRERYNTSGACRDATTFECRIPFENLDLKTLCTNLGKLTAKLKVQSDTGTDYEKLFCINSAATKLPYYLELAPTMEGTVEVKKENSARTKCSWTKATEAASHSPVHGYCVELRYRAGESGAFSTIEGLTAVKEGSSYWLRKTESLAMMSLEALEDEPAIEEYEVAGGNIEVYIPDPDVTEIYFNPAELGIEKDYQMKVAVYPFTVYGLPVDYAPTVDEILSSSLLTGTGVSSEALNKQLGLVRVKTASGWKEGQVWVKTASGWKESTGVYIKTANGWKESV